MNNESNNEQRFPFDEALQLVLLSYRLTIHSTTDESPGFLTYGVDLRPPVENDWRFTRSWDERARIQYLSKMRMDVQFQAIKNIEKRNDSMNENRTNISFQPGELILTRHTPLEISRLAHSTGCQKLVPRWSLPCRVLQVLSGGKKAIARNLLTGTIKEIHIQDARFVGLPQGDIQYKEWRKMIESATDCIFDDDTRQEVLKKFWNVLETPQDATQQLPVKKRVRELVEASGGSVDRVFNPK